MRTGACRISFLIFANSTYGRQDCKGWLKSFTIFAAFAFVIMTNIKRYLLGFEINIAKLYFLSQLRSTLLWNIFITFKTCKWLLTWSGPIPRVPWWKRNWKWRWTRIHGRMASMSCWNSKGPGTFPRCSWEVRRILRGFRATSSPCRPYPTWCGSKGLPTPSSRAPGELCSRIYFPMIVSYLSNSM